MSFEDDFLLTAAVAIGFALVHVFGRRMRFLQVIPRSLWLSAAGGVSLSYVFVHLLPELSEHQENATGRIELGAADDLMIYIIALLGLCTFYGLDRLVRASHSASPGDVEPIPAFWIHVASYAAYSLLIGYLLVHRDDETTRGLLIYAVALGLHFVVNDQGLRQAHGPQYDRKARWILAAAPPVGWLLGIGTEIPPLGVALTFSFLAGGIILNVLKEELPEDRESRFWALAAGAATFTILLLLSR